MQVLGIESRPSARAVGLSAVKISLQHLRNENLKKLQLPHSMSETFNHNFNSCISLCGKRWQHSRGTEDMDAKPMPHYYVSSYMASAPVLINTFNTDSLTSALVQEFTQAGERAQWIKVLPVGERWLSS